MKKKNPRQAPHWKRLEMTIDYVQMQQTWKNIKDEICADPARLNLFYTELVELLPIDDYMDAYSQLVTEVKTKKDEMNG